jgi:SAM-dependent methyltransferase
VAEHNGLYGRSRYYDIACSRDVGPEVDFLVELFRRRRGRAPVTLLDVACGPGYHARAFAAAGGRAVGLDLRPEMIAYAADQAAAEPHVEWLIGDMRDFRLAEPVDLAVCATSGIDCLLTNAELVQHLRAVASNMAADGLYVVELAHPRDCNPYDYGNWRYAGERAGTRVTIDWATNRPFYDPVSHVAQVELTIRVQELGEETVYTDSALERYVSAQEITLLCGLSQVFEAVAWYGAFDFGQPLDNSPSASTMLGVLARSGS